MQIHLRKAALAVLFFFMIGRDMAFGAAFHQPSWPVSQGDEWAVNGVLAVDSAHAQDGYILVQVTRQTRRRVKLAVTHNDQALIYELKGTGEQSVIPLQLGSGEYHLSLYKYVRDERYISGGQMTLDVSLSDERAAFYYPNVYVNYAEGDPVVRQSEALCAQCETEAEAFTTISEYIAGHFSYDIVLNETQLLGDIEPHEALPDIARCMADKRGNCQDLAATMAAMLRAQGIACELIIGYADGYYHAWTITWINGEEIFFDPSAAIGAIHAEHYEAERCY